MVIQHFIEVESFLDFARYVCAIREFPLRVYAFPYKNKKILATNYFLSNSILCFYSFFPNDGTYLSYKNQGGNENASVVDATKNFSNYAPIIELKKPQFPIRTIKRIKDKLKPVLVKELGDLARLTYDPQFPEEYDVTLFCFQLKKKWIIGYITEVDLDDPLYCFNFVELENKPQFPFLRYSDHKGIPNKFSSKFEHGFPYLPIVFLKSNPPVFGL